MLCLTGESEAKVGRGGGGVTDSMVVLLNLSWAKGPFPGPYARVGTPSNNTIGSHAGLPVIGDEYP